jgi:hypothetical protein
MTGHGACLPGSQATLSQSSTNSPFVACEGTTASTQMTAYHDVLSFTDEVLSLVGETSEKFIPAPSQDQVLSDLLERLHRFKETVQRKDHFRTQHVQKEQEAAGLKGLGLPSSPPTYPHPSASSDASVGSTEDDPTANLSGLRTGL